MTSGKSGNRSDGSVENRPKGPPKSGRRRAREYALQGLYQWLLSGHHDGSNDANNTADIEAHIRETIGFAKADAAHFSALLHHSIQNAAALRAAIAPHLDRPIAELSPVEHAILLIGAEELAHHPDIPYKVVINEAVEVAKSFGGTDGYRYVNGVLDKVAAALRMPEMAQRRGKSV